AGPTRAADPAVVHRTLAALLVSHWPEPGLKSERSARVGVVLRCPRHGCGRGTISIVICGGTVVGSTGQRAGSGVPYFSSVRCQTSRPRIPHIDCGVRAGGDFIEPQVGNRVL